MESKDELEFEASQSAFESWRDAKSNWINVKIFNKKPIERPDAQSNSTQQDQFLGSMVFANMLNLQQSLESDYGRKMNGYFANHLLLFHEMFCNECYTPRHSNRLDCDVLSDGLSEEKNVVSELGEQIHSQVFKENSDVKKTTCSQSTQTTQKSNVMKISPKIFGRKNLSSKKSINNAKSMIKNARNRRSRSAQQSVTNSDSKKSNKPVNLSLKNSKKLESGKKDVSDFVNSDVVLPQSSNSNTDEDEGDDNNDFDLQSASSISEDESSKPISSHRYEFKCHLCERSFNRPVNLRTHIDIHHEGKKLTCEICKKEYTSARSLRNHQLVHTEEPVDCTECGKKFQSSLSLKNHSKAHEPGRESHLCDFCGKEFFSKHTLKNHQLVHLEDRNFVCDICGKAFKRFFNLTTHKVIHTGEKLHSCDICGLAFRYSSLVYKHKKKKHGTRDQLCNICGKAFFTAELLKRHERIHSEEPHFKCRECGKGYRSETGYKSHLNTHIGIVPNVCQICGKAFNSASNMYKHIARHKKIKHHFCDTCNKGFLTKQELITHSKVHESMKGDGQVRCAPEKNIIHNREKIQQLPLVTGGSCVYASSQVPARKPPRPNVPPTSGHIHYPPYEFEDYRYF